MRNLNPAICHPSARHMRFLHRILSIAIIALASCAEDNDPELEKRTFMSVFDNHEYSAVFFPIDVRETPDGGYLILAEKQIEKSNFRGSYLLKVDATGNFERDMALNHLANPVGDLMAIQDRFYFLTVDTLSLQGQLVATNAQLDSVSIAPLPQVGFPCAAAADGAAFLVLSYDHADCASVVTRHDPQGNVVKGPASFSIGAGDDVEEPIMDHILRTGRRFPFQVGKVSEGLYFFNGFENYSFSLVFTNLEDNSPVGVVQGQQDDGGLSAVVPLGNDRFAVSRFDFGKNYFLPGVPLATNGPTSSAYLDGLTLPELVPDADVRILRTTIRSKDVLIYASNTRSKQIGLFFYDERDGAFISSRYLGFSNPFEVSAVIRTADEGLVVCGTTWLAGRFPRICLFRISEEALAKQVE